MRKVHQNTTFDLIKGLACIAVVLIHYNYPGDLGLAVKSFCRFGVPCFLCVSGFFLGGDDGVFTEQQVVKRMRKILNLIVASFLCYAIFCWAYNSIISPDFSMIAYIKEKYTAGRIVKFFVTNDPVSYPHLWYLLAVFYCYLLVALLGHKVVKAMCPGAIILLVACYSCLQEFGSTLGIRRSIPIPGTDLAIFFFNLFMFRALPFFLFGYWLRMNQGRFTQTRDGKKGSPITFIVVAILGCCMGVLERFVFEEAQFYVGSFVAVVSLFWMALRWPHAKGWLVTLGRDYSLYVYLFHIAVGKTTDLCASKLHINTELVYIAVRPILVVGLSILVAILLHTVVSYGKAWFQKYRGSGGTLKPC